MSSDSASGQPGSPAPLPKEHDPYQALRVRDFKLYVGSGLMSVIGGQIMGVTLGYELYRRTKNPMALAWLGLVQVLPMLVLGLPAGQIADWFDRKRILLAAQVLSVLCAFGLALLSWYPHTSLVLIYLTVLVRSTAGAFGAPARQSLLPQIIPVDTFANAVTWNSSIFQMAFVIGPALGGQIIGLGAETPGAGEVADASLRAAVAGAFFVDATFTLMGAILTALIKRPYKAITREPATLANLVAGLHFVWNTKVILGSLTLDLFAVLLGGATALMPIYAEDILHVGPVGLGWMRSAPAVGAVSMALLLTHLPPMKSAGKTLLWSVAGYGAATIVFGFSTHFWLSLLMLFLTGAFDNISVVVRHSLVQLMTPDEMRGRVSAVNSMFIGASNRLGEFESGLVAYYFSAVIAVVSGGIGTLLVVAGIALKWPQVRRIGMLSDVRPDSTAQKETSEKPSDWLKGRRD